jgi:hypothetical protein
MGLNPGNRPTFAFHTALPRGPIASANARAPAPVHLAVMRVPRRNPSDSALLAHARTLARGPLVGRPLPSTATRNELRS